MISISLKRDNQLYQVSRDASPLLSKIQLLLFINIHLKNHRCWSKFSKHSQKMEASCLVFVLRRNDSHRRLNKTCNIKTVVDQLATCGLNLVATISDQDSTN
jgi:hypothetical protein